MSSKQSVPRREWVVGIAVAVGWRFVLGSVQWMAAVLGTVLQRCLVEVVGLPGQPVFFVH